MAVKTVYTVPPDVPFLDALAEKLLRDAGDNPLALADYLVLLPTRRACLHLREVFRQRMNGRAALLPRMQPLGDLDEDELYFTADSDANLDIPPAITPLRRQLLLARMIVGKEPDMPLDQATLLADALARLLDEVQTEQRDFSGLEKLVAEKELAEHWQATVQFLSILTDNWPSVLAEEGCIDPADRRNRVLQAQADAWRANPPSGPVIAAGSTGSMPATATLLEVIASMPQGTVILPGLDQVLPEDAWQAITESHPQYGMKTLLEQFGVERTDVKLWGAANILSARVHLLQESMRPAEVSEEWRNLTRADIPPEALNGLTCLTLDHPQEEARAIALLMRHALETPGKTAALVTPDRALAERVSVILDRWNIRVNDSGGTSLSARPIGGFLIDILAAASPDAKPVDTLSLLKHPLAACGLSTADCRARARQIEIDLFRNRHIQGVFLNRDQSGSPPLEGGARGGVSSDKADVVFNGDNPPPNLPLKGGGILKARIEQSHFWFQQFKQLLQPITENWHRALPLVERIEAHRKLAERIATSNTETGAARLWHGEEGETAATWLDDWNTASRGFPLLTGAEYMELFKGLIRTVTLRPAWGLHPRLSILGPLEARLLHIDCVILGGLNEGVWPPEASIDPWMSRPMKTDFGLPLPERRIGLSAHDFVQLASADEVVLTRSVSMEGAPSVPSRFVLQLETVLRALGYSDETKTALAPHEPWQDWARALDEPYEIKPCSPPEPRPATEQRPTQLSVTEIGTWQRNPYAIYARHILKLNALEPLETKPEAADRGTIIHEALDDFIKQYPENLPDNALDELLALGRKSFAEYEGHPEVRAFWWPRFERVAAWFIEEEQTRRANGITVLQGEAKGRMALDGFTLRGRADRMEKLPDGTLGIVDYKTGYVPTQKEVAAGYEPQLPLLALIASEGGFDGIAASPVSELAYWKLNGGRDGSKIEQRGKDITIVAKARAGLEQLITKFADPATPYQAVPKPDLQPRYDDYAHLARLQEWGRTEEDR